MLPCVLENQNPNWQEQGVVVSITDGVLAVSGLANIVSSASLQYGLASNLAVSLFENVLSQLLSNVELSGYSECTNIVSNTVLWLESSLWNDLIIVVPTFWLLELLILCCSLLFLFGVWVLVRSCYLDVCLYLKPIICKAWVTLWSKVYFYSLLFTTYLILSSFVILLANQWFGSVYVNISVLSFLLLGLVCVLLFNWLTGWFDRLHFACNLVYLGSSLNLSLTTFVYSVGLRALSFGTIEGVLVVANYSCVLLLAGVWEIPNITADFDGTVTGKPHEAIWEALPLELRSNFAELNVKRRDVRVHDDLLKLVEVMNRNPVKGVCLLNEHRYRYIELCTNDWYTNDEGRSYLFSKIKKLRRDSVLGRWAFGDTTQVDAAMFHFGPSFNSIANSEMWHPHQIICASGSPKHPLHCYGDLFFFKSIGGVEPSEWTRFKYIAWNDWTDVHFHGVELKDQTRSSGDYRNVFHGDQALVSKASEVCILTHNVPAWFTSSLEIAGRQAGQNGLLLGLYSPDAVRYINQLNFVSDSYDGANVASFNREVEYNSWANPAFISAPEVHQAFRPIFGYRPDVSLTLTDGRVLSQTQMERVIGLASQTNIQSYSRVHSNIHNLALQRAPVLHQSLDFIHVGVRAVIRGLKIGR